MGYNRSGVIVKAVYLHLHVLITVPKKPNNKCKPIRYFKHLIITHKIAYLEFSVAFYATFFGRMIHFPHVVEYWYQICNFMWSDQKFEDIQLILLPTQMNFILNAEQYISVIFIVNHTPKSIYHNMDKTVTLSEHNYIFES